MCYLRAAVFWNFGWNRRPSLGLIFRESAIWCPSFLIWGQDKTRVHMYQVFQLIGCVNGLVKQADIS